MIANYVHGRMLDHQEIEWQFDVADLESAERWLELHPSISGLALVSGTTKELSDTYYDTEDRRLYLAGYSLRVRDPSRSIPKCRPRRTPPSASSRSTGRRSPVPARRRSA